MKWVVIAENGPKAFGPFSSEKKAVDWAYATYADADMVWSKGNLIPRGVHVVALNKENP